MSVGSSTVQLRVRHWRKSTRILHQHYKKLFTNATKCVAKARILALATILKNSVQQQTKALIIVTQHCGQVRIHSLQKQLESNVCLETIG